MEEIKANFGEVLTASEIEKVLYWELYNKGIDFTFLSYLERSKDES